MKKEMSEFTSLYQLSKTLRFALIPQGKTWEYFCASGMLEHDQTRSEKYPKVKKLLDQEHKALLERSLSMENIRKMITDKEKNNSDVIVLTPVPDLNWSNLAEAFNLFRKSSRDEEAKKSLVDLTKQFRNRIVASFKFDTLYEPLTDTTPSDYLKKMLQQEADSNENKNDEIEAFSSFACYFKGYQENRKNIYSVEAQSTAAAYRAINVNFPKFLDIIQVFDTLQTKYPEIIIQAQTDLVPILGEKQLADIFNITSYSAFLSQSGIDYLNSIIGGYTQENGAKIRGINEFINLYRQINENAKLDRSLVKMPQLFKQILSDREAFSFIPEQFESDDVVRQSLQLFHESLIKKGAYGTFFDEVKQLFATISLEDDIMLLASELSQISIKLCGSWDAIDHALKEYAEQNIPQKNKAREKWLKKSEYSFSELSKLNLTRIEGENVTAVNLLELWQGEKSNLSQLLNRIEKELYPAVETALAIDHDTKLQEQQETISAVKAYLDGIMELMHSLKAFNVDPEAGNGSTFYNDFTSLYSKLEEAIALYNRIRNYVTKKPQDADKIKLMFDCPTLADGWDIDKEKDNLCVILERNEQFYLGIMNKKAKIKWQVDSIASSNQCYRKMEYKLLPGPNKMLPKVILKSKKNLAFFNPSPLLLEKYDKGMHKKGANFDLAFCHELIDFFKISIKKRPEWNVLDFHFSDTSSYSGIDEFYREVEAQGYKLSFTNIPVSQVEQFVDEGRLFLFKIHNKDFQPGAKGKPNLHTLYWRYLFAPENLKDVILKLNGEAELFFRKPVIKKATVHRIGEKFVNRITVDGKPIPDSTHLEIFNFVNNRSTQLGENAKLLLESKKVIVKDVKHEITKDKRYTHNQMMFHVPLTINFKAPKQPIQFNMKVIDYLRDNPDVNIIGIDRGERNLIYLTLINQKGEILLQKSFNTVENADYKGVNHQTDYHEKLNQREKERDAARKSWSEIGKIKDLKAGFLSLIVHEISKLMIQHHAIVVLEDLNFGFKRGRFCIEKQVYQKFEKALIEKLNYLFFKENEPFAPGGILNGYQLTDKFSSFEKLGKQCGFLFYIPAAYTSKIDPTTGFVNLFNLKDVTNSERKKAFFSKFDSISYDSKRNAFVFSFDYSNFPTTQSSFKTSWSVYSALERIVYNSKTQQTETIYPTKMILAALKERGVEAVDGFDLLTYIKQLDVTKSNQDNIILLSEVFYAFSKTLQMRNSSAKTGEDYIQSPVLNSSNTFFDSRNGDEKMPLDADANGAYHIALKGVYLLQNIISKATKNSGLKIDHKEWFKFVQERNK